MLKKVPNEKSMFATLTTSAAIVISVIFSLQLFAAEHIAFFISGPLVTFPLSYLFWQWTFKNDSEKSIPLMLGMSFVLTFCIYYFNFVALGVGRFICYYTTGGCTDYAGNVKSLFATFTWVSIIRTFIALYYLGLISWALIFGIGLFVMKNKKLLPRKI